MNDQELKKLIQQSRAIQGYLSYTPNQLEQALGAWRVGLAELSQDELGPAIQAAMAAYESGPFNPAFIRKVFYQNHPPAEIEEADAIRAMKQLALEVVNWPDASAAKENILKPIVEWIKKRPAPTWRSWEKKVVDALESETENRPA